MRPPRTRASWTSSASRGWRRRWRRCAAIVIVVDASVLVTALGDDGPDGDHARARLRGERLSAPELVDLEVTSCLGAYVNIVARMARVDA